MIFAQNMCNLCSECSRNRQLHFGRAWWRWGRVIFSLNQITLIFEIVMFILYKRVNHGLGKIYVTFAESVLETGDSTLGEHADVGVVLYSH